VLLKSSPRIQLSEELGNIYFSPLHKDDEGSYNCTASNDVGTATSTGSLHVLGRFYFLLLKIAFRINVSLGCLLIRTWAGNLTAPALVMLQSLEILFLFTGC
jgi:Immunoglobulin I-set domain